MAIPGWISSTETLWPQAYSLGVLCDGEFAQVVTTERMELFMRGKRGLCREMDSNDYSRLGSDRSKILSTLWFIKLTCGG